MPAGAGPAALSARATPAAAVCGGAVVVARIDPVQQRAEAAFFVAQRGGAGVGRGLDAGEAAGDGVFQEDGRVRWLVDPSETIVEIREVEEAATAATLPVILTVSRDEVTKRWTIKAVGVNRDLGASVLTRVELPHQPAFACLAAGPRIVWLSAPDLHIAEPLCVGEATSTLVTVHNFRDAQVTGLRCYELPHAGSTVVADVVNERGADTKTTLVGLDSTPEGTEACLGVPSEYHAVCSCLAVEGDVMFLGTMTKQVVELSLVGPDVRCLPLSDIPVAVNAVRLKGRSDILVIRYKDGLVSLVPRCGGVEVPINLADHEAIVSGWVSSRWHDTVVRVSELSASISVKDVDYDEPPHRDPKRPSEDLIGHAAQETSVREQVVKQLAGAVADRVERAQWSLVTAQVNLNRKQKFLGEVLESIKGDMVRLHPSHFALVPLWESDMATVMADSVPPHTSGDALEHPAAATRVHRVTFRTGRLTVTLQNIGATPCAPAISVVSLVHHPIECVSQCRPTAIVLPGESTTCIVTFREHPHPFGEVALILHPNGIHFNLEAGVIGVFHLHECEEGVKVGEGETVGTFDDTFGAANVVDFVCRSRHALLGTTLQTRARHAGWVEVPKDSTTSLRMLNSCTLRCPVGSISTWLADGCDWLRLTASSPSQLHELASEVAAFLPEDAIVVATSNTPFENIIPAIRQRISDIECLQDCHVQSYILLREQARLDDISLP